MKLNHLHKKKSKREFLHRRLLSCISVVIFVILLNISGTLSAQWKKIAQFPKFVHAVFFKEYTATPLDGFVSLDANGPPQQDLWRTLDGGNTWTQITLASGNLGYYPAPVSFTFKNSSEGWFCSFEGSDIYKTVDGGNSWNQLAGSPAVYSVFYVPLTNNLLIADGDFGVGIAFSDSIHGIMTSSNSGTHHPLRYTVDAGITWQPTTQYGEQYQPVGVPGTTTFFAMAEQDLFSNSQTSLLIRSDDGGQSWRRVYRFHDSSEYSVTGTLYYNSNRIFFQTAKDGSEGIMVSEDSGYTFHSICGPNNILDTRFYVRDSFIYSGDKQGGLWLNTTGIGSNSTPQLSLTQIIAPALLQCQTFDSLFSFTFFDSCANTQAKLVSASISGSNNFSFSSPSAIPRIIHPNDSLFISYNPQTSQPDTAQLHLRFHLGWKDFDSVISLFGAGRIPKENVHFIPSLSKNAASAGTGIDLYVMPDKAISGRGLQSISFDLNYIGDLLDIQSFLNNITTSIPGATITPGIRTHSGRTETLPLTITGTDLSLDPKLPIADVKFEAMITDTASTTITMTDLKLNGGDANYANCVLSADTSNTNFTEVFLCGDTTLYNYLHTGKLLDIISIRPNPSQDEIELDLHSVMNQDAVVEIFDALGAKVFSEVRNIGAGSNSLHLDMTSLSGGMYLLRVGAASQSFMKVK